MTIWDLWASWLDPKFANIVRDTKYHKQCSAIQNVAIQNLHLTHVASKYFTFVMTYILSCQFLVLNIFIM